jgi:hypothetical protein
MHIEKQFIVDQPICLKKTSPQRTPAEKRIVIVGHAQIRETQLLEGLRKRRRRLDTPPFLNPTTPV